MMLIKESSKVAKIHSLMMKLRKNTKDLGKELGSVNSQEILLKDMVGFPAYEKRIIGEIDDLCYKLSDLYSADFGAKRHLYVV